ncbi:MAG: hypothetical protein M4579_004213 [Chaenotheca gracillima]|nr:MAG: hypothetical protein M4579_004213 [Chaenotheca gracillima]
MTSHISHVPSNAAFATMYRSPVRPSPNRRYRGPVEFHRRFDSPEIKSSEYFDTIDQGVECRVAASKSPVQSQQYQAYVMALLARLTTQRFIPAGNAACLIRTAQINHRTSRDAERGPIVRTVPPSSSTEQTTSSLASQSPPRTPVPSQMNEQATTDADPRALTSSRRSRSAQRRAERLQNSSAFVA